MKKLLGILVLGLLWCNVGFAECIEGDCNNGYGTFTWTDGAKYVGEFKDGLQHGQGTFTYSDGSVVKGIWENSKLVELKKRSYEKPLIMKMEMAANEYPGKGLSIQLKMDTLSKISQKVMPYIPVTSAF